jgi:hypothetical protein
MGATSSWPSARPEHHYSPSSSLRSQSSLQFSLVSRFPALAEFVWPLYAALSRILGEGR